MTDAIARAHDIAAIASNSSSHDVVRWHSPLGPELQYLAAHPTQTAIVAAMLACIGVFVHVARERVNALKAEFLSDGVDLTRVEDRIDTLQYLKKMHERGMLPLGLEVCAMKQAENEVLFLGPVGVEKWRAYYRERGIDIDGAEDMKRVQKYVRDLHYLEGCLLEVDVESLMLSDGN